MQETAFQRFQQSQRVAVALRRYVNRQLKPEPEHSSTETPDFGEFGSEPERVCRGCGLPEFSCDCDNGQLGQ